MEIDVTKDRDKYIGGSDIPVLFGISHFKTRWQLLLEKAEPSKYGIHNEVTNDAIEYGNVMEPKIRDFVNYLWDANFTPDQRIIDDLRANTDGWDSIPNFILEIKTTSIIHERVEDYKYYLVQLLFYMKIYGAKIGFLAVYHRPEDYNEEFDSTRLQIFKVAIEHYENLCEEIDFQIERFRADLIKVKNNPLITEQDLQPNEVIVAAQWLIGAERQLEMMKHYEQEVKSAKAELKRAMEKHGIKRWITNSGVKVTLVGDSPDGIVQELDTKRLKEEQPDLYEKYLVDKIKKGKSGYVLVTPPKGR